MRFCWLRWRYQKLMLKRWAIGSIHRSTPLSPQARFPSSASKQPCDELDRRDFCPPIQWSPNNHRGSHLRARNLWISERPRLYSGASGRRRSLQWHLGRESSIQSHDKGHRSRALSCQRCQGFSRKGQHSTTIPSSHFGWGSEDLHRRYNFFLFEGNDIRYNISIGRINDLGLTNVFGENENGCRNVRSLSIGCNNKRWKIQRKKSCSHSFGRNYEYIALFLYFES